MTKRDWSSFLGGQGTGLVTGLILVVLGTLIALFSGTQDWMGFTVVLVAPLAVILILHNPTVGLWLILLLFPLAASAPTGNLFLVINYLMPLLVLYSGLIRLLHLKETPRSLDYRLYRWFLAFIVLIVGTSLFHSSPVDSLIVGYRYFILFLMITMYENFWSPTTIGRALMVFALVLVPLSLIALYTMASQGIEGVLFARGDQPERIASIYANPNTFGLLMGHGLVVFMAYLLATSRQGTTLARSFRWTVILVLTLILGAGLLISFSRSSYVYTAVALLVLLFTKQRVRWIALGGTGAAIIALFVMPLPAWVYLTLRVGSGLSFRTSLWEAGWNMMKDNPLTGIGTGTGVFEMYRPEYLDSAAVRGLLKAPAGSAHNVFLARGAELGVLGLVLVIVLFFLLWKRVPAALREFSDGKWITGAAAAGMIGLSVHGIFESGATVGLGKIGNSLIFFLFAITLFRVQEEAGGPEIKGPTGDR